MKNLFVARFLFVFLVCSTAWAEDKNAVKAWKKYNADVRSVLKTNDWARAGELLKLAVIEAEKFGSEDERLVNTLRLQANAYTQLRDYVEADPIYRRTLAINEKKHGTNSIDLVPDLSGLGEVCSYCARYDESDAYLQRAQSIVEWKHGAYDPAVGIFVANRAFIYSMAERFDEAEAAFQKALKLIANPRTETHFEMNYVVGESTAQLRPEYRANLLSNLGLVHCRQKKYDAAEKDFLETIKIRESEYGKNSATLIGVLFNQSRAYSGQKKWPEAEKVLRRAWDIARKSVAPTHPIVRDTGRELVSVLKNEGKQEEAAALSKEIPKAAH